MKNKKFNGYLIAGCIITGIIVLWIVIGRFYTPYPPTKMSSAKLQAPSAAHLFGTDKFGRDIFSRVMQGSGTTLMIAALTILIGSGAGIIIGAITGYFGGMVDEVLMRLNPRYADGFRLAAGRELYHQRKADGGGQSAHPAGTHAAQYAPCIASGAYDWI